MFNVHIWKKVGFCVYVESTVLSGVSVEIQCDTPLDGTAITKFAIAGHNLQVSGADAIRAIVASDVLRAAAQEITRLASKYAVSMRASEFAMESFSHEA